MAGYITTGVRNNLKGRKHPLPVILPEKMNIKVTLTQKVVLLVLVSLVIQVGLFVQMDALQSEAEHEFTRANDSRRVTESINQLAKNVYELIDSLNGDKLVQIAFTGDRFRNVERSFRQQYKVLKRLFKDEPEKLAIITDSENSTNNCYSILREVKQKYDQGETLTYTDSRRDFNKRLKQYLPNIVSDELISLGQEAKDVSERSPENQAEIRMRHRQTLIAYNLGFVLFTIASAWLFGQYITRRLNIMTDNTYRLAANAPLNPTLSGRDEIANLDQVFHKMAAELKESARRERAILDNAQDMICSFDENGKFIAVNPACLEILGYEQEELIGSHFVDLVSEDDRNSIIKAIDDVVDGSTEPVEIRMICHNRSVITTSWRVRWSPDERTFFCVMHDISAQKEAERMKQEVVAMITHDLRTPLTVIENFLEMLSMGALGDMNEKGTRLLSLAERGSRRMMGLINDLLDIEKIKAGMMELDQSNVPVSDIFEEAAESLSGWATDHGVTLKCEPTDLVAHVDGDRICRVVSNLVSNAVKYSPAYTEVNVSASQNNGNITIAIRDQGRGIPQDKIATIFNRFEQVRSTEDQKTGSGLGLAICKAIVELHGGTIGVESEEGRGSTFTFQIPAAK
jgi:PAS domain S-box